MSLEWQFGLGYVKVLVGGTGEGHAGLYMAAGDTMRYARSGEHQRAGPHNIRHVVSR